MKTVALQANPQKRECIQALQKLAVWLLAREIAVRIPEETEGRLPAGVEVLPEDEFLVGADLLVVLGGDGTLLRAARGAYRHRVPILGVNFGTLGFLTDVDVGEMIQALEQVFDGEYRVQPRLMLRADVLEGEVVVESVVGLNDCVIREDGGRSVDIQTSIGGVPLANFRGDGIIVSTPTGSTAYSLSAGGPIVEPSLQVLMATAICPHTFSVRPLLIPAQEEIEVGYVSRGEHVHLFVDGQFVVELGSTQRVRVRRAQRLIHFILVGNRSFYEVLRSKLRWGGV